MNEEFRRIRMMCMGRTKKHTHMHLDMNATYIMCTHVLYIFTCEHRYSTCIHMAYLRMCICKAKKEA